jgi:hypothetical protein
MFNELATALCDGDYIQRDLKVISRKPTKGLSPEEVRKVTEMCLDEAIQGYQERVINLGMMNPGETPDDLVGEAYILFNAVLTSFDHKKAKKEKSPLWNRKRAGYLRSAFLLFYREQLALSLSLVEESQTEKANACLRLAEMQPDLEAIPFVYRFGDDDDSGCMVV